MKIPSVIQLQQWVDEHRHLLKPPVGNKVIWADDFIVMVVGGPNHRTDFHYDEGPELFYQLEGEMRLDLMQGGQRESINIKAGEIYLLPPRVPHSPQRMEKSIGLVVERKRLAHEKDGLMWFCQNCDRKLFETYFHLNNIESQFAGIFEQFNRSGARTCQHCGEQNPAA